MMLFILKHRLKLSLNNFLNYRPNYQFYSIILMVSRICRVSFNCIALSYFLMYIWIYSWACVDYDLFMETAQARGRNLPVRQILRTAHHGEARYIESTSNDMHLLTGKNYSYKALLTTNTSEYWSTAFRVFLLINFYCYVVSCRHTLANVRPSIDHQYSQVISFSSIQDETKTFT